VVLDWLGSDGSVDRCLIPACCLLLSRLLQFGSPFPMEDPDRTRTRHLSIPGSSRLAHPRAWSMVPGSSSLLLVVWRGLPLPSAPASHLLHLRHHWHRCRGGSSSGPPASFAQGGHSSSQQPPLPRTITLAMNGAAPVQLCSLASVMAAMAYWRARPSGHHRLSWEQGRMVPAR